ncbi:transcriptional regulator [Bacillus phage CAM003]|uniref:Helix-turn-helix binding domain protein n=5 Tax=Bastillevirus TaxID=1918010 RepID=A0A024B0A9_9CAUD|nr:transcriptional regulator [Bacillus phage Hoody T]YP_009035594.1 transcriptional regulator [Bacillus phage Evoli]YP_009036974.1 transcriptional regulator [Bacillus phage CAM003]AMW61826.1 helix-turn-helix binding domain protein [Bacillus phage Vinny]ASR79592.1 helix-turn-helix binding domain protein [Bacillus phage OTooleKemple52]ASR79750.1 helix turn helix binding protein [Bacillus phage Janet]ASU00922.1 helix-turn-helix DNA binding domain protein [Bacillus phage Anthony]AXQ67289.1 helix
MIYKNKEVVLRLRKVRLDRNIDIPELCQKLNVSYSTVSNWERGLRFPRKDKLMQLEDMFNMNYRDLFAELSDEEVRGLKDKK